jgi:hypothetical protein
MKKQLIIGLLAIGMISCAKSQVPPGQENKSEIISGTDTLAYIYSTSQKINEKIVPYFENLIQNSQKEFKELKELKKMDSLTFIKSSNELNTKQIFSGAYIMKLQGKRTTDSTTISNISLLYNDAVKGVNNSTLITPLDILKILSPISKSLTSVPNLDDYLYLTNLLEKMDKYLLEDFINLSTLNKNIADLSEAQTKFAKYSALKKEADKLLTKLQGYANKIKQCHDHLERYFVTWKDNTLGDRILYLEGVLKDFRDYPYLLSILFNSIDKPSGGNPLKGKL